MAVQKKIKDSDTKQGKKYWLIDEANKVEEVSEEQILSNPQKFFNKNIWDKPPNQYEIVVTLKRKK